MRFWPFLILLFIQQSLSAQFKPEEKLILGDSIVFLGIDFSVAKFYNPEKVDKSIFIRDRHGPDWGLIDDIIVHHGYMESDLHKKYVQSMSSLFDSSYKYLDSTWVINYDYGGISDSDISAHLKTYAPIANHRLALTILVDKMDISKTAAICAVYFDQRDMKMIKVIRSEGKSSGGMDFGYHAWFTMAIENAYHAFTLSNAKYLKELKKTFK
jgi:hypothetical protein